MEDGAYANLALGAALDRDPDLSPPDRALCTELVYGTLRHLPLLDHALARASDRPLKRLQPEVLFPVRVAAYETLHLNRAPHAAVHEAVEQVKRTRGEQAARFANAVLRGLLRLRDGGSLVLAPEPGPEGLAARTGLPPWLAGDVVARLGEEGAGRFGLASLERPRVHLCAPAGREPVLAALAAQGKTATAHALCQTAVVMEEGAGAVDLLAPVREGRAYVQDAASQLVAAWGVTLAGQHPAPLVLDLCAAPGGKSALLASRGFTLVSGDLHVDKLHLARRQWGTLGVAPRAVVLDAGCPPFPDGVAQVVLLDAPCTGTGLLARRPEIKLRRTEADLRTLVALQARLLAAAAPLVKPGGSLLYSVCSVTRDEGPRQARTFLSLHPDFRLEAPPAGLAPLAVEDGMLALWPHRDGTDGFFAAHFRRAG
jgi:16S rRNA (cytosine967-C5)-methyltransferase